MLRLPLLSALALATLSTTALAYDLGNGMVGSGEVKLEYVDGGEETTVLSADYLLSWRSGGALGFDAALDTLYSSHASTDVTNIWAALVLSTSYGDFAVGAPRPVLETMGVMPRFSSSRLLDVETTFARGPYATLVSYDDPGVTPGLSYMQSGGDLSYGLSLHRLVQNGEDTGIVEAAMNFARGQTTFFITGEFIEADKDDVTHVQIGALHAGDRFELGAVLGNVLQSGDNHLVGRAYGSYAILPALTVKGDVLAIRDSRDLYSVSAEYTFGQTGFVEGGATMVGSDAIYDLGVGLKF